MDLAWAYRRSIAWTLWIAYVATAIWITRGRL